MKVLRFVLWGAAVVAALVLVIIALAFNSSVQTWAARRALSAQTGIKGEVGRVSAGLHSVVLENISIRKPGLALTLPSLAIDMPVTSAASGRIAVRRLVAKGWKVDLWVPTSEERAAMALQPTAAAPAKQAPAAEPAQPFVFDGLLKQVGLPVDFSLDEIDVEGEANLHAVAGLPPAHATLRVTGGKLAAGTDGRFNVLTKLTIDDPNSPVTSLEIASTVVVMMATPRTLQAVTVATDLTAVGPKFPQGAHLHSDVVLKSKDEGETYLVSVQTPTAGDLKNLFALDATYAPAIGTIVGKWKVDAVTADVAPFVLGFKMPAFSASGDGSFEADCALKSVHASGRFDSTVEQLESFMPELVTLGRIRTQVDFDLAKEASDIRIDRLSVAVSGAKPIASVQALQKFDYDLGTRALRISDSSTELLRLTLHGLPLDWAKPFLKGISISGDDIRGEFFLSARTNGFALRPAAPITVDKLSVSQNGQPLLKDVNIAIKMSADALQQGWQAEVSDFSIHSGLSTLLTASFKAGQATDGSKQPIVATGKMEASLPALLAQPMAAKYASLLSAGTLNGEFSASISDTKQISAKFDVVDLASAKAEKLPKLQLSARADVLPQGRIEAHVPVVVDAAGRKSDIALNAQITLKPALDVQAEIVSTVIYVQDLQSLQALASTLPSEPQPTETAKTSAGQQPKTASSVADKAPFWKGCTGQLKLALKEIVYSPEVKIANVGGVLKIEAGAIDLQNLKAVLGAESEATLNGKMSFDGKVADPYGFSGAAKVTGFDPAPYFRASNPKREPTVEGRFDVTSNLSGRAPNAALLPSKIKADLSLTSRGGTFRGLALPTSFSERFQGKSGNLLSNLSGVVGALGGGSKAGNAAATASELATMLAAIPFDQLNVQLTHDGESALTKIQEFTLISPTIRLAGSGSILQQEGVPLLKQPLTAQMELSAHGRLADLLSKQGMLQGGADSLGYSPLFSPVKLDGTLSDVGTDALMNLLMQKLLQSSAGSIGNLFGK